MGAKRWERWLGRDRREVRRMRTSVFVSKGYTAENFRKGCAALLQRRQDAGQRSTLIFYRSYVFFLSGYRHLPGPGRTFACGHRKSGIRIRMPRVSGEELARGWDIPVLTGGNGAIFLRRSAWDHRPCRRFRRARRGFRDGGRASQRPFHPQCAAYPGRRP